MIALLFALHALLSFAGAPPAQAASAPVARTSWLDDVAATPDGGMRLGNPRARVKLVEYGSRVCAHCALFNAEGLPVLKARYIATGKVSYEFREFPVAGALDLAPILLGRCVPARQFFPVLDRMMRSQADLLAAQPAVTRSIKPNATPEEVIGRYAQDLGYLGFMERSGYARAKLLACLRDRRALQRIVTETRTTEQQHHVRGTPTFEINGATVAGVHDWAGLQGPLAAAAG